MLAVVVLASLVAEARPRVLDPGAALQSLGGLAEPLEAEGWTLTPMRGSTVQAGDVIDPTDNQVQVTGPDCFGTGAVRRGGALSASVNQALQASGRGRAGLVSIKASASKSLDVAISGAEIAEIPVGALQPTTSCVTQLQVLASQGYDVNRFQVVQSVLYADLVLASCLEGSASVRAPGAGGSVSGSDCRGVEGSRVALAVRTEVASTALGNAGVDIAGPPPRVGLEDPGRKRKKKDRPPCWLLGPCDPYPPELYLSTTGKGPTMAAADADARARLLGPFEVRFRGLASTVGEDPEGAAQQARGRLEAVTQLPARHQDGTTYYTLAAIERKPLAMELEQRIAAEEARLQDAASGPLAVAQEACAQAGAVESLVFLHAQLAALTLRPSRPPVSLQAARQDCLTAKAALTVGVPEGALGEQLAAVLSAGGLTVVPVTQDDAAVKILVESSESSRPVSGLTSVTLRGAITVLAEGAAPVTLTAEGRAASANPDRARADAARDLDTNVAAALTTWFQERIP